MANLDEEERAIALGSGGGEGVLEREREGTNSWQMVVTLLVMENSAVESREGQTREKSTGSYA